MRTRFRSSVKDFLKRELPWKYFNIFWRLYFGIVLKRSSIRQLVSLNKSSYKQYEFGGRFGGLGRTVEPKNILFMMHWFELGGAESYALHCMKAAKSAGHKSFAMSTVHSDDHDLKIFKENADEVVRYHTFGGVETFLPYVLDYIDRNNIGIVHVHHSALFYHFLPVIKNARPYLKVIDSNHIVEYGNGGFPELGAYYSQYIDVHNVISASLAQYMMSSGVRKYREIPEDKFFLTYLTNLTSVHSGYNSQFQNKKSRTLLFYARLDYQKQPYMFIEIIRQLNKVSRDIVFKGVVVGSGKLERELKSKIARDGLGSVIEFRGRIDEKEKVFAEVDFLVLTSINEGITLTTYEAIRYGLPVVSSNVGAQSEFLCDEFLVNIWQNNPIKEYCDKIIELSESSSLAFCLQKQKQRLAEFDEKSATFSRIANLYEA